MKAPIGIKLWVEKKKKKKKKKLFENIELL